MSLNVMLRSCCTPLLCDTVRSVFCLDVVFESVNMASSEKAFETKYMKS